MVNRARSLWQTATAFTQKVPTAVLTHEGPAESRRISAASAIRERTSYAATTGSGACFLQLNHRIRISPMLLSTKLHM